MTEVALFVESLTKSACRWVAAKRGVIIALVSLTGAGCASPQITADPVYYPPAPAAAHAVHIGQPRIGSSRGAGPLLRG